ncbi:MAG TPA: histidine kinase dimerization/phospho-acceptor domain-containing protein [Terriglobales bacterium]|nr:histidine kinase dimerization/phospho-acceptor domain-containing protein [Terriglobales bacterium]
MSHSSVLIISDDVEFAHTIMGRWQVERNVPAFTLMSSDSWCEKHAGDYALGILGQVRGNRASVMLGMLDSSPIPTIYVAADGSRAAALRSSHSRLHIVSAYDGWADFVVQLGGEILRRVDADSRAREAEQEAAAAKRNAMLGRYMLEMRHGLNNALTSILGHAELMLLEPGTLSGHERDQLETIHSMAVRLHEIMQRFTSLETELKFAEKKSQPETRFRTSSLVSVQ